jgi:hypothetical protein
LFRAIDVQSSRRKYRRCNDVKQLLLVSNVSTPLVGSGDLSSVRAVLYANSFTNDSFARTRCRGDLRKDRAHVKHFLAELREMLGFA